VIKVLATLLFVSIAMACLLGALYHRSQGEVRQAVLLRANSDARATVAIQARAVMLRTIADLERTARLCRDDSAEIERRAVDAERTSCDQLIEAATSGGRLDVDAGNLDLVVLALRGRRQ
jgi:hypothetical protein